MKKNIKFKVAELNHPEKNLEKEFENPSIEDIEREVMALDWDKLCGIWLTVDKTHYIECSGTKYEDEEGYAIIYQDGNADFITIDPKLSIEGIIKVLQEYLKGDEDWKKRYLFEPFRTDKNGDKILKPVENPLKKTIHLCFFPVLVMIVTFLTKSYKLCTVSGLISLFAIYLSFKDYWLPNIRIKKKGDRKRSFSRDDYLSD